MDTERKEHFEGPKETTFGEIDRYFRENFNTVLSPDEEWRFHTVCDEMCKCLEDELTDYDLRGAFKDGGLYVNVLPNKYRKPNHPLFDTESIYDGMPDIHHGGEYEGGSWGRSESGRDVFIPSKKMIATTHPKGWLKGWMVNHHPSILLMLDMDNGRD